MTSLTLPRRLLPVALLLVDDGAALDGLSPAIAAGLEECGALSGGCLSREAGDLLGTMAAAATLVSVDVASADRHRRIGVWSGPDRAVWSHSIDGLLTLTAIDHIEVPLLLLQVTGLGTRPGPVDVTPLHFSAVELESIRDWAAIDAAAARRLVRSAVGSDAGAMGFVASLVGMRGEWSVCISWLAADGLPHSETLDIIDGAEAGYWQIETTDSDSVVVTARSTETVNRMLHALLPRDHWRMAG